MLKGVSRSLAVAIAALAVPNAALAVCSSYHGLATVNEIQDRGSSAYFVEIRILDDDIDSATYNGWTVNLCSVDAGGCSGTIPLGSGDDSGFPWIVVDQDEIQDRDIIDLDGMDVILQDAAGDTIDYVTVEGHNPQRDPSCAGAFDSTADGASGSGLVRRVPDGTGDWEYNGQPNEDTSSEDNSGDPSLPALSVDDDTVIPGDTAYFTITLDATAGADVTFEYQTVEDTATSPEDFVAVSGSVTIPAGSTTAQIGVPTQALSDGGGFYLRLSNVTNASATDGVGRGTIVAPALAEYRMDAAGWNGGSGEVIDSSGNGYDGTPSSGLSTIPAQVCNGGDFLGGDYVTVPDADALSPLATDGAMTISGWVRRNPGGNGTLVHKGAPLFFGASIHEYRVFLDSGQLRARLWPYSGFFSSGPITVTVGQTLAEDSWYFFALVAERGSGDGISAELRLYSASSLVGSASVADADFFDNYDSKLLSEDLLLGVFQGGSLQDYLDGTLDELRIHNRALSPGETVALRDETRPCPTSGPSAIVIEHDGSAVTCQAEPVTVRVVDGAGDPVTDFSGTIGLSTSTGNGAWSVIDPANDAFGSLNQVGGADDGQASYTFDPTDNGEAVLGLRNTHIEDVDIDAVQQGDASVTDDDSEGLLTFAEVGFQFLTGGAPGNIGNQIGGKPSDVSPGAQSLELQAIRTNDQTGACEAAFQGATDVEFAFECMDPGTCQASTLAVNGTAIAASAGSAQSAYQTVSMDFGDATDTTASLRFRYDDVGRIRLLPRKTLTPNGQVMTGPSNAFVVRPFGFAVSAAGNPAASGPGGGVYTAAGVPFDVTVSAVLWSSADDTDANGIPDGHDDSTVSGSEAVLGDNAVAANFGQESGGGAGVALVGELRQPSGGSDPGLSSGSTVSGFTGGSATVSARFDEVGIIELKAGVIGGTYLGVNATDAVGASGYVGRFTPAQFTTDIDNPTGSFAPACTAGSTGFTYTGQDFGYTLSPSYTAEARAADAAGASITVNYRGAFNKLASVGFSSSIANSGTDAGTGLEWTRTAGSVTATGNGDGTTDLVLDGDTFTYAKQQAANTEIAPFNPDIRIGLSAYSDSDGVSATDLPAELPVDGTGTQIRYGRFTVANAYGSEMLPLEMPLAAEYFDGNGYVVNTADSCTAYDATNVTFENYSGDLSSGEVAAYGSGALSGGRGDPANPLVVGGTGGANTGPGESGAVDVLLGVPAYLRYDWDAGAAGLEDPRGRANFGIYRGSDNVIFQREVY